MTTLLERKIKFARKHWRALDGPFEIAEDGWLLREYWLPAHSFRLAAVDTSRLCLSCAPTAGELVQEYAPPRCSKRSKDCAGLKCEPIQFILLDLPRRSGKTTGSLALSAGDLFRGEDERIGFLAGSEDQSDRLFTDHVQAPIIETPYLDKRARVVGSKVLAWKSPADKRRGKPHLNFFEYLSTSISGATGGKYTRLIIEEARNVPAPVAAALIPAVWDQNGWRCGVGARGHTKTKGDLDDPQHPTKCSTCGSDLQPWVGQLIAQSSAGEKTGGDRDWFFDLCDEQEKTPHPRVHMYRAQEVINRKVARSSVSATSQIFGAVESLRDHIEIETSNQSRRRGEDFLSHNDIAACVDSKLTNRASGERVGVAFLDTSDVIDMTSLVIVEDDSGDDPTWTRIVTARIDTWDPKKLGRIDDRALEKHLDDHVPLFKLLRLRVDDRHAPWVRNLVARLEQKPWGKIVVGCTEYTRDDRRFAWNELERRFLSKTMRMQDHATLRAELRGARKRFDADNRMDVREAGTRNKSGVRHLDVAEALAGCCYDVHALMTKPQGPSMSRMREISSSVSDRINRLRAPRVAEKRYEDGW